MMNGTNDKVIKRNKLIRGCIYCFLWYSSILAGYAGLFCPLLPVLFVSNRLYRFCTDVLFAFWQTYATALLESVCRTRVRVTGDRLRSGESSLMVMNHRTRTDWNFVWAAAYHATQEQEDEGGGDRNRRFRRRLGAITHPIKFVLKDIIRHVPGPGWVMQLACFLYVKRSWSCDERKMRNLIDYYCDLKYKFTMFLFPEGTDLTERTKLLSDRYAEKNNLQKYDHVLHPRTTGFTYLADRLLKANHLDAIYDVTLVYCDTVPQTEGSLITGDFPCTVKMHLMRYPASVLPKTVDGLKEFIESRWSEKERAIAEYEKTGRFINNNQLNKTSSSSLLRRQNNAFEIYAALVFWTLLPYVVVYQLAVNQWFRAIVFGHTVFLLLLNWTCCDGFQEFEIAVGATKRRLLGRTF